MSQPLYDPANPAVSILSRVEDLILGWSVAAGRREQIAAGDTASEADVSALQALPLVEECLRHVAPSILALLESLKIESAPFCRFTITPRLALVVDALVTIRTAKARAALVKHEEELRPESMSEEGAPGTSGKTTFAEKVVSAVLANKDKNWSVRRLAQELHVDPSTLYRNAEKDQVIRAALESLRAQRPLRKGHIDVSEDGGGHRRQTVDAVADEDE
jgi:hypothetical protein